MSLPETVAALMQRVRDARLRFQDEWAEGEGNGRRQRANHRVDRRVRR